MRQQSAILIALMLACSAGASVVFDLGDTVSVTDNAALTLPDGNWTIAFWMKLPGASTDVRYFADWGSWGANNSILIAVNSSTAYPAHCLAVRYWGSGGAATLSQAGSPGDATEWVHVTLCRASGFLHVYVYEDGAESAEISAGSISGGCNSTADWVFGTAVFAGRLAEWAKWDRALSSAERAALVAGGLPEEASGGVPDWQIDMWNAFDSQYPAGGLTIANDGAAIDQTMHPIDRGAAAPAAVTNTWPIQGSVVNHRTQIFWTPTPPDTEFAQTYTVKIGTSNPPTTTLVADTSDLIVDSGVMDDGATYYVRVDAKGTVGGVTTEGTVVTFTTEAAATHLYYVGPYATGSGSGADVSNLMAWSGVSATESDAVIRLIDPNTVMFYEYENTQATPYTEWPDRIYESRTVIEYEITRNFQDWRRIFRFVDGSYAGVGPVYIVSYSPARAIVEWSGKATNGMMVNPAGPGFGLDQRNDTGYLEGSIYTASLDHGDELPYLVPSDYPSSVLNCVSMTNEDCTSDNWWWYAMKTFSVFTVVETGLANNTWFRPSYRWTSSNSVKYQWSDVLTDRIPQLDLDGTGPLYSTGYRRHTSTEDVMALEPTVDRPTVEFLSGWTNNHIAAFYNGASYGGNWAKENGLAYLACFDSGLGTLADKKRLIIGCIQKGIDLFGVYQQFLGNATMDDWYASDGGCNMGKYWPIVFAGICLDDEDMLGIGPATHQHDEVNWTITGGWPFQENQQIVEIASNFHESGLNFWQTPPWSITTEDVNDSSGTVKVTNGSTTVTGLSGETWGTTATGKSSNFCLTQVVSDVTCMLDATRDSLITSRAYTVTTVDRVSDPPTLTLSSPFQGATNTSGVSFIVAEHIALGKQFKVANEDYSEFDATWDGTAWWTEKPQYGYNISGSVYNEAAYQGINTDAMLGFALCANIMNENAGYPAVQVWDCDRFFEYYDWCITSGNGGSDYLKAVAADRWVYPTTDWEAPSGTKATDPSPGDFASDVAIAATLSWTAGTGAVKHNVYLDTHSGNLELVTAEPQTETTFDPTLVNDTTYYWRVDELDADGNPTAGAGTEWTFTTTEIPPATDATNPSPANLTTAQKRMGTSVVLSWTAGDGAPTHDVWFGTSVEGMTLRADGQAGTTYTVSGLSANTTYYWRVNEVAGETTGDGDVWTFTTRPARMLFWQ